MEHLGYSYMKAQQYWCQHNKAQTCKCDFRCIAELFVLKLVPHDRVRVDIVFGLLFFLFIISVHELKLEGFLFHNFYLLPLLYQMLDSNPIILMKLTTLKSNQHNKSVGLVNVFKLKKMIQTAANGSSEYHISSKITPKDNNKLKINCTLGNSVRLNKNQHLAKSTQHIDPCQSVRSMSERNSDKENIGKFMNNNNQIKQGFSNEIVSVYNTKMINSVKIQDYSLKKIQKSRSSHEIFHQKFKNLKKSALIIKQKIQKQHDMSIKMFKLGKKLGRGRFGNVYMAEYIETNFLMAIKIINKKQVKKAQMEEQLISEIKLQMYMKHPNILQMYGFFHDQNNIYLMLELGEQSLFRMLRKKDNFSEKQTAYYIKQILEGLKYMHCQSIIHRDLKPQNILIVKNVVKLADFGWSVYSPQYKRQTFCGTLDYVPPEIVKGQFYDQSADVWSLGVLLYQLKIGKAPFQGNVSQEETFQRILDGNFHLPPTMSNQLQQLIKMSLQKNPKKRISLNKIQQSKWLRKFQKQGRSIASQIWRYWEHAC